MGVAARWSIARCNGELIYLGRARRGGLSVVTIQNYRPVTVSTPDLDFLFNEYANPSDAIAFSYRQNGHEFYQISFQQQGVTWLYDATSQVWSTLLSGATTRHYANFGCQFDFQFPQLHDLPSGRKFRNPLVLSGVLAQVVDYLGPQVGLIKGFESFIGEIDSFGNIKKVGMLLYRLLRVCRRLLLEFLFFPLG